MKYILMGRTHVSYTGYAGWGEWMELEKFKDKQNAEFALKKQLEYISRQTWEYKIVAR